MPSRRTWLRLISCLVLLLVLLGAYGYLSLSRLLEREQIKHLEWRGLGLSTQGIQLDQLSLQHPSGAVQLHQLQLRWSGFSLALPFWQQVQITNLQLNLPSQPASAVDDNSDFALPLEQLAAVISLLPQRVQVDALQIELPCADTRCQLLGDLLLVKQAAQLDAQLNLQHQQDQLRWHAQLQGDATTAALQLSLTINQQPQLQLSSSLQQSATGQVWQGALTGDLQQSAVLHSWLSQWLPTRAGTLPETPAAAQLQASWQLQLAPGPLNLAQLQQASGQWQASANLPEPWPIPAIGELQGSFDLSAQALDGQWLADSLSADLSLKQIANDLISGVPAELYPEALQLNIQTTEMPAAIAEQLRGRALPLTLQLTGKGRSPFELKGTLILANGLPWGLQLLGGSLNASIPAFQQGDWKIGALQAQLQLDAYLDPQQLDLTLGTGSQLSLEHLRSGELDAEQLKASSGLKLQAQLAAGALQDWQLKGPLDLSAQLQHSQLQPQRWYWHGPVNANPQQVTLDGTLRNDAGLQLKLQAQHSSARGLSLHAQLAELFLRGGNPLQGSFSAWPALLELNNGRLNANASLTLASDQQLPTVKLELTGKDLGGIYDRTALEGLDSRLTVQIDPKQLQLEVNELRLRQADPGMPVGPVQLKGRYSAALQTPALGVLQLQHAEAALMGGKLQLAPGQWSMAGEPLLFPIQVQGLELEQLFILYPTEGLAGTGTLDGDLPLQIGSQGVTIEQGQLSARAPGGKLQFHSQRIRALGRSNPAMQLVTQSLEDFRFTTLSSQVNYDQQGKLALAIRLEGQNPAIEQGRPIHFTINLEEDIPTLLASLQLTDKVSDIIKQRVQQRMLERNAKTAPTDP
ncbi:MAG: YdbH domain-containing protein [Pseudomonas sp.]|uniref:YdbH domain-containing protein n=1 Tax=Pseudomonas sp. TaxID=306 RepID=UPI0027264D04|nr:YdbH domain-containing protein [Pseudomonas sp.]MDO9617286.1 YdbH domain-containing protein [Pseudomonas sp.]MDP2444868.1 YdbH domain-containing protein [Pseudomonas sp.]MDZ4336594.1 YdbH domain-containing protein [Pseudomonas sp.]